MQEIRRRYREAKPRADQELEELYAKVMNVLNPEQRAAFPELALGLDVPTDYSVELLHLPGERGLPVPSCHPYLVDLSDRSVQKALALTETQRNRMQEILGKSATLDQRIEDEALRLSPEQRNALRSNGPFTVVVNSNSSTPTSGFASNWRKSQRNTQAASEEQNPLWALFDQLLDQLESVLTPDQFAAYKHMVVRSITPRVIRSSIVAKKLGLTKEQQSALRRLHSEHLEAEQRHPREIGEKMVQVLTPEQRAKLLDVIDKVEDEELARADAWADQQKDQTSAKPSADAKEQGKKKDTAKNFGRAAGIVDFYSRPGRR